jgi:predicted transcriptional regulator
MKIRKVKIAIKSFDAVLGNVKNTMKRIADGDDVKRENGVYFENLAAFKRALTEKRLMMLHTIKERRPSSIYALAKMLGRDIKNVTTDLEYLRAIGLVEMKRSGEKRERVIPEVNYDKIGLEIAV